MSIRPLSETQLVNHLTVPHRAGQTLVYCDLDWCSQNEIALAVKLPLFQYDRAILFGDTKVKAIGLWVPSNGSEADYNARRECLWVHTPSQAEAEDDQARFAEINGVSAPMEAGQPVPISPGLHELGCVVELRSGDRSVYLASVDARPTLLETLRLAQQGVRPARAEVLSAPENLLFPSVHLAVDLPIKEQTRRISLEIKVDNSLPPSHLQSTGHLLPARAFTIREPFLVWVGGNAKDVPFCAWIADASAFDPWGN